MSDDTTALALALDRQRVVLRRELERLVGVTARVGRGPAVGSWQGIARNAFDHEFEVLRTSLSRAVAALDDALAFTGRALDSVAGHGG